MPVSVETIHRPRVRSHYYMVTPNTINVASINLRLMTHVADHAEGYTEAWLGSFLTWNEMENLREWHNGKVVVGVHEGRPVYSIQTLTKWISHIIYE